MNRRFHWHSKWVILCFIWSEMTSKRGWHPWYGCSCVPIGRHNVLWWLLFDHFLWMRFHFSILIICCTSQHLVSTALKVRFLHLDFTIGALPFWFAKILHPCLGWQISNYLLYIRMSGFHSADGGILTSSTFPYSLVFHAKLTSSHSWREKRVWNQVQLRVSYDTGWSKRLCFIICLWRT